MKNSLLAIALAAATVPFTFAAQAPAATGSNAPQAESGTAKTKKHVKKTHKVKKNAATNNAAPATK
jgi:hypothetical protein